MTNEVLNARKRLERCGEENSLTSLKLKRSALVVAATICRNFPLPVSQGIEIIVLTRPIYQIAWCSRRAWTAFEICHNGYYYQWLFPDFVDVQHMSVANMKLSHVYRFAEDVASGFLVEIKSQVARDYGLKALGNFRAALGYKDVPIFDLMALAGLAR